MIDRELYITEFSKRIISFLDTCPALISFRTENNKIIFTNERLNKEMDFTINIKKFPNVKDFIAEIKSKFLEKWFPVFYEKRVDILPLTEEEQSIYLEEGLIPPCKKQVIEIPWRIEKFIKNKNEFFVRSLITDKLYRIRMKFPAIMFLKKLQEVGPKADEITSLFQNKKILNEIYKEYDANSGGISALF